MYAGLVIASIVCDLLNSQRYVDNNAGIKLIVNDRDGNLAVVYWDGNVRRWKWREGVDSEMLEEWAQQSQYKVQLQSPENGDEDV